MVTHSLEIGLYPFLVSAAVHVTMAEVKRALPQWKKTRCLHYHVRVCFCMHTNHDMSTQRTLSYYVVLIVADTHQCIFILLLSKLRKRRNEDLKNKSFSARGYALTVHFRL